MNSPGIDGWDPAVTFDAKGLIHVVWCGFQDGDYDVYWRRAEAEPRRLSAHGEYDLHPWIAASPDGTASSGCNCTATESRQSHRALDVPTTMTLSGGR